MTRSYLDNCGNSRANTCFPSSDRRGTSAFISSKPIVRGVRRKAGARASPLVTLDNFELIAWPFCAGDISFKCLPYQMSMVRDMPTMLITGNGESGFDSGEGA